MEWLFSIYSKLAISLVDKKTSKKKMMVAMMVQEHNKKEMEILCKRNGNFTSLMKDEVIVM